MAGKELYFAEDPDALKAMAPHVTSGALRRWFHSLPLLETDPAYPKVRLFEGSDGSVYDVTLGKRDNVMHRTTRLCLTEQDRIGTRDNRVTFLGREGHITQDENGKYLPYPNWRPYDISFLSGVLAWRRMSSTRYELIQKGSQFRWSYEVPIARVESFAPMDPGTAEARLLGLVALMAQARPEPQPAAPSDLGPINKMPGLILI